MALLQKGVAAFTRRMPKLLSPRGHAVADWLTIAALGLLATSFWNRNRRAAVAALLCGAAEAGVALLTDYPGGILGVIDLSDHRALDMSLAAATFTMPGILAFDDEAESRALRLLGLSITAVAGLTEFEPRKRKHSASSAA